VCTPVVEEETMRRSSPTVDNVEVANVWEATEEPFRDVIVPPDPPASVPQVNVPLAQRSFSVDVLQDVKLAPKSDARVRPPVEEALRKERELVVSEDAVVVARVEVPSTERRPEDERLDDWRAPDTVSAVALALVKVVSPVTLRVEEKDPAVPMSDP
jgi:hypothetical protein